MGTIVAISDQEGKFVEKRLFDAWGQIAKYQDNQGNTMPIEGRMFIDRGYTGHEMILPNAEQLGFGFVNMNGRLYDPKLHRFLMPDQNIQNPYNTQNYNRYTYVLNNPLRYIDPSGEEGVDGNSGHCDGCSTFTAEQQQTAIGSAIATIANNWDNWKIKDWSNRNFNIKNIGNSVGNGLNSINNFFIRNIQSIAEDIGGWFGIPKHHDAPQPVVQNFQLNGPLPSGLGMDSGNYMGGDLANAGNYLGGTIGLLNEHNIFQFYNAAPSGMYAVNYNGSLKYWSDGFMGGTRGNISSEFVKNASSQAKSVRFVSKISGYASAVGNVLGYYGAGVNLFNGNYSGAAIEGISNTLSIRIAATRGNLPGLGYSIGWSLGGFLSHTEIYNRLLFGRQSAIYQQRDFENGWTIDRILGN